MIKILIVEDELIIQRGLLYKINWLKHNCIVVGCAEDGVEGEKKIEKYKPDIVITDIRMPFKDGLSMIRDTIKKNDYRAIILSGYEEFDYAQQAINLGVEEYLLKPLDLNFFEEILEKLVTEILQESKRKSVELSEKIASEVLNFNFENHKLSDYIIESINFISENYNNKITLDIISDHIGLTSIAINTKFREETDYSFSEFLNRYRILKAIEMLQDDKILVYEIAQKCGFREYKYFSKVFKDYVGTSPKKFVNSNRF